MKSQMYFIFASYFRYFARIILQRWSPRIIAVTGTAGKTSALYLIASALKAKYSVYISKKANSAIGISYSILGLSPQTYSPVEFLSFLFLAPLHCVYYSIFIRTEKIFIVELDVDRPLEMEFMSTFIHPEVVYWVSCYAMHTESFAALVDKKVCKDEITAVAHEYAKICNNTYYEAPKLIVAADNEHIKEALESKRRTTWFITQGVSGTVQSWDIGRKRTTFDIKIDTDIITFTINRIVPRNFGYTAAAVYRIGSYFKLPRQIITEALNDFVLPPGRSTILNGVNNTTLIDSSYNSSLEAAEGMLELLSRYLRRRKIAVFGDMRELGRLSESEHIKLAKSIALHKIDQVMLVGPQTLQYIVPYLMDHGYTTQTVHHFSSSYQAGVYLKERLSKQGDVILFKASQNTLFFEIMVEMMLENKNDSNVLCRREPLWQEKRQKVITDFYRQIQKQ